MRKTNFERLNDLSCVEQDDRMQQKSSDNRFCPCSLSSLAVNAPTGQLKKSLLAGDNDCKQLQRSHRRIAARGKALWHSR